MKLSESEARIPIGGKRKKISERGCDAAILFTGLLHDALLNEGLKLFVSPEAEHLFASLCGIARPKIGVKDFE